MIALIPDPQDNFYFLIDFFFLLPMHNRLKVENCYNKGYKLQNLMFLIINLVVCNFHMKEQNRYSHATRTMSYKF